MRFVAGDDGREKIQMRIDLGLIQMETTGRPDGERPGGSTSRCSSTTRRRRRKPSSAVDAFPCGSKLLER